MFIPLHHRASGRLFYIPASHITIIDEKEEPNKVDVKQPGERYTVVMTIIMMGQNSVTFQVRESPDEVATLVNEMLNTVARATKIN